MDRRSYLKTSLALGGTLLLPAGVLSLVGCSGTVKPPELSGFDGKIMGTGYSVRLGKTAMVDEALANQVHVVLQDVDAHMSTWRSDSELSRFNNSSDGDWHEMTAETIRVIAHSLGTSQSSEGAFDVTVGPLVDLWGFGAGAAQLNNGSRGRKPGEQAIRQNLARVGHEAIEVNLENNAVRKQVADARLDLSGIAKGHGVDRVADLLDSLGIDSYLVEVGGELKSRGLKPDGTAWKVAIERPAAGTRDVFRVVNLQNSAIATSGDYRNFFADGGHRYSHSIDPRSGQPVSHELASVSVVADSTMAADALSTALMIMGPDAAMDFAEQNGVAAYLILKSGSSLKEVYSQTFEKLLA